jgi:hypothetical protein
VFSVDSFGTDLTGLFSLHLLFVVLWFFQIWEAFRSFFLPESVKIFKKWCGVEAVEEGKALWATFSGRLRLISLSLQQGHLCSLRSLQ